MTESPISAFFSRSHVPIYGVLQVAPCWAGLAAEKAGLSYNTAKKVLRALTAAGVVTERKRGRTHYFQLNRLNPLTGKILDTLKNWSGQD
jgi:DNA-binding transcriptional ArsR family regulator